MLTTAGGGGKRECEVFIRSMQRARQSAAALGMMECILKRASPYRNQVIGDSYGKACHLSETVQYKDVKKLTEETPSTIYDRRIVSWVKQQ
jgi:acetyl-CoA carboxylase biotin carboxylase subunit